MADTVLPQPDPQVLDNFLRAQARALRANDRPPATKAAWDERRTQLRKDMFAAMGFPEEPPIPLEVKDYGVLKRQGYRIEKLAFQSMPDVWVSANAYVPDVKGKFPAVLVVHGHWPWARIDPVVQARCLGLVKLGFFVLSVDAFGAGERYTAPARGTYHGALYGSTLWPTGRTLLGQQVFDNRRAVDYLLSRPEVNGQLGITGASGGGNQTMYAGALDDRFGAVVPVCSVGTYQAYLHAACCVCEVLPGALRFTEEGDVLGLVAPRALLVINATKDGFQFSVGEAEKSVARARAVFQLYAADARLRHRPFESPHAYNQPMREAMYGWMTRWLKNEGTGEPINEPAHEVEKPEDLRCWPDDARPKGFLFPPSLAAREGRALVAKLNEKKWEHVEDWESHAVYARSQLRKQIFGAFPKRPKIDAKLFATAQADGIATTPVLLHPEPELPMPLLFRTLAKAEQPQPACVLLHMDGKAEALKHPLAEAFLKKGWAVLAPDLRGTGETKPQNAAIRGAPDHHIAEHALWIGRPLLGQWVFDVQVALDWLALQPGLDKRRFFVAGIGQAGVVALCAGALFDDQVAGVVTLGAPVTLVTEEEYGSGTYMGVLAPGILRVADVPLLAALVAPRRLIVAEGITPQGKGLNVAFLQEMFGLPKSVYRLCRAPARMTVSQDGNPINLVESLH